MKQIARIEIAVSVLFLLGLFFFGYRHGLNHDVGTLLHNRRGVIYGPLFSLFGALFGFAITLTSLCLNLTGNPRFQPLRKQEAYPNLFKYFTVTIVVLGVTTVVTFLALLVDRNNAPFLPLTYLVAAFGLGSLFCLSNCVYALKLIIDVATRESIGRAGGSRECVSPNLVGAVDKEE